MIKHLVMFYFTDKVNDENRDEIKRLIADSVKKIKDADIKGVSELKAVFNIADGMPEVGLYGEFENDEALRNYQSHPEHKRHIELTKDLCKDRTVFDWE